MVLTPVLVRVIQRRGLNLITKGKCIDCINSNIIRVHITYVRRYSASTYNSVAGGCVRRYLCTGSG